MTARAPRTLTEAMGMTPAEVAELRARCYRLAKPVGERIA